MDYLLFAVLAWAFLVRAPRFNEPLAADYGAHFYLAQRWDEGVVLYRDMDGAKPPLLYYLNVLIYKFWGKSPAAIRSFFALYNLATVALVYFLARRLYGPEAGLAASILFATVSALPHFWGSFSHQENFMMLPLIGSLYAYISGSDSGSILLLALSGLLCGAAYQFKQTALLNFLALLAHSVFFAVDFSLAALLAAAFMLPIAAPIPYFASKGRDCARRYIYVAFQLCGIISKGGAAQYVKMRQKQGLKGDLNRAVGYLGPIASLSSVFWAAATVGAIGADNGWTAAIAVWSVAAAAAAVAQRTYFPSHFLTIVPSAAVLAGWTISQLLRGAAASGLELSSAAGLASAFVLTILLFWAAKLAVYLWQFSLSYSHQEVLFRLLGPWAARWIAAAEIGGYMKSNSDPGDSVLQWGMEPEIYFYSDRKSASRTMFWHPPAPGWEKELVGSINSERPKFVVFMEQDLKMEELQKAIEHRYELEKVFSGQFKLYRRVDPVAQATAVRRNGGQAAPAGEPRIDGAADCALTSIVVLTYNELTYTKQCIDSVVKCTDKPYELIVVDNGSTDGTQEYLKSLPGVRTIFNHENRGFARGNNQGMAAAKGDFILLLNNDVVVTPGWLGGLQKAISRSADIGMAGPRSNYVSGAQQDQTARYRTFEEMEHHAREVSRMNCGAVSETDRLVGFCILIKKRLLDKIGGFDERFASGNFEDDDLCLRARMAGSRLVIAMDVFVHHFGSRTFIGNNIDYASSIERNKKLFFDKWGLDQAPDGSIRDTIGDGARMARFYNSTGMSCSREGKLSEAKQCFQKAIVADSGFAEGWSNLGVIEWGEGLKDEAFDKFEKAAACDILNLNALANLVTTGLELGNYGTVETALKSHLEKRADNLEARFWLASCHYLKGQSETAGKMIEEILRIDPNHSGALSLRDEISACARGEKRVGSS